LIKYASSSKFFAAAPLLETTSDILWRLAKAVLQLTSVFTIHEHAEACESKIDIGPGRQLQTSPDRIIHLVRFAQINEKPLSQATECRWWRTDA
jgi:hypothetical protein